MDIPYTYEIRRDTGLTNGKIGIWLFLASEVMLFGALFASYILIRSGAPSWPRGDTILDVPMATFNTIVLIASSVTMVMAWASLMRRQFPKFRMYMGATVGDNPWEATTIEWSAPSPPPHGNFVGTPEAYRGPYEYSVPGAPKDFVPQYEAS